MLFGFFLSKKEVSMKIRKKLNNNVVIAVNKMNVEFVLVGKGLAYGKTIHDEIETAEAEKVFKIRGKGVAEKLSRIIEDIPLEHVKVCDEIINFAKRELKEELNEKIYLTLIDHLSFAIERHNAGIDISSLLKFEIKKIAPEEFRVALAALDIVEKRLHIRLPDDEAVYIAFHILDSRTTEDPFTLKSIEFVANIMKTIRSEYEINCDEDYQPYNRFIIHLQYLARRIFQPDKVLKIEDDLFLYQKLKEELPETHRCVCLIEQKIWEDYSFQLNENEKSYLMVHLYHLIS